MTSTAPYTFVIACHFGVTGDVASGGPPYAFGKPCSGCSADQPLCEKTLCRRDPVCGRMTSCPRGGERNTNTCECPMSLAAPSAARLKISGGVIITSLLAACIIVAAAIGLVVQIRKYRTVDWLQDRCETDSDEENEAQIPEIQRVATRNQNCAVAWCQR